MPLAPPVTTTTLPSSCMAGDCTSVGSGTSGCDVGAFLRQAVAAASIVATVTAMRSWPHGSGISTGTSTPPST